MATAISGTGSSNLNLLLDGSLWDGGLTAQLTITNTGNVPLAGWSLSFESDVLISGTPWGLTFTVTQLPDGHYGYRLTGQPIAVMTVRQLGDREGQSPGSATDQHITFKGKTPTRQGHIASVRDRQLRRQATVPERAIQQQIEIGTPCTGNRSCHEKSAFPLDSRSGQPPLTIPQRGYFPAHPGTIGLKQTPTGQRSAPPRLKPILARTSPQPHSRRVYITEPLCRCQRHCGSGWCPPQAGGAC